jgi:hypothetical protein
MSAEAVTDKSVKSTLLKQSIKAAQRAIRLQFEPLKKVIFAEKNNLIQAV